MVREDQEASAAMKNDEAATTAETTAGPDDGGMTPAAEEEEAGGAISKGKGEGEVDASTGVVASNGDVEDSGADRVVGEARTPKMYTVTVDNLDKVRR